jgi:hypothetical protein
MSPPEEVAGIPGRGAAHDLASLAAVVYREEEAGEYVGKHDEWLAATRDWTFDRSGTSCTRGPVIALSSVAG